MLVRGFRHDRCYARASNQNDKPQMFLHKQHRRNKFETEQVYVNVVVFSPCMNVAFLHNKDAGCDCLCKTDSSVPASVLSSHTTLTK